MWENPTGPPGWKGFCMKKRHSAEQIVGILRQADVSLGKGQKVPEVCKQLGISEQTYYCWRTKYGGMDPQMARQLDDGAALGLFVDVSARFNLQTGLITWTFSALDPTSLDLPMDALAGFLPPNTS